MTFTYVMTMSFGDRPLHANQRLHWATRARAVTAVRDEVMVRARMHKLPKDQGHARIDVVWYPPKKYQTDADNLAPLRKAIVDGLALGKGRVKGYGVVPDDTPQYVSGECRIGEPIPGGRVVVTVTVS